MGAKMHFDDVSEEFAIWVGYHFGGRYYTIPTVFRMLTARQIDFMLNRVIRHFGGQRNICMWLLDTTPLTLKQFQIIYSFFALEVLHRDTLTATHIDYLLFGGCKLFGHDNRVLNHPSCTEAQKVCYHLKHGNS